MSKNENRNNSAKKANVTTDSDSTLLFVWRDVDSICKVMSFGDHFDLLWAVVDNIGPGQTQKRLNISFQEFLGKVMIIGGIKGARSHGNDIIHTVGMNRRTDSKTISITRGEELSRRKVQLRCSTCAGVHA